MKRHKGQLCTGGRHKLDFAEENQGALLAQNITDDQAKAGSDDAHHDGHQWRGSMVQRALAPTMENSASPIASAHMISVMRDSTR
jgi:hypothetical protein